MKRAERLVAGESEGTTPDPANRLDGVDDVENGNLLGRGYQREAALLASLRLDQPCPDETLHHFGEVVGRNLGGGCDRLASDATLTMVGEPDDGAQGVFSSAGEHCWISR